MNFMSGRGGFYEEITTGSSTTGMSSSSSSSPSSLQHKAHPLYTYHHHQEHYGGGGRAQLTDNNGGGRDEDSDDHMLVRRAGGGEGSTSTGTGTISHVVMEKEHMFDKVVTPSDVGKLNRLVIPKQHAEKYFPLDSSTNEKGLLLNFEDRNGKPWRFRYSYWNSSQSYVMTKGWSRFVKEKKLDAGDIVSFQRGVGELGKDRLFIDWRRRPDAPDLPPSSLSIPHHFSFQRSSIHPWNPLFLHHPPPPPPSRDYSSQMYQNNHQVYGYGGPNYGYNSSNVVNGNPCPPGSLVYLRSSGAAAGGVYASPEMGLVHSQRGITGVHYQEQMVYESVPVVQGKAAAKRLRLFGVNMDCPISESDEQCDDHILSSTTMPLIHHMNNGLMQPPTSSSSSIPYLQLGHNYSDTSDDDKGKGSMSLDLDI